jgi:hypothetical protein
MSKPRALAVLALRSLSRVASLDRQEAWSAEIARRLGGKVSRLSGSRGLSRSGTMQRPKPF